MKEIDVFKLANFLGFDVRGAELKDCVNSMMLINEYCDKIIGFDSNKVIAYNCKKNIDIKRNTVANNLYKYIINKKNAENLYLANISTNSELNIDIKILIEEVINQGFLTRKKDIKRLYKKMY